jgi:hypothetical protein
VPWIAGFLEQALGVVFQLLHPLRQSFGIADALLGLPLGLLEPLPLRLEIALDPVLPVFGHHVPLSLVCSTLGCWGANRN